MDGQPTFLILVLTVVALLQVQPHHRPALFAVGLPPSDQPAEVSRCNGIELDTGCAMQEMWDVPPPPKSP